MKTFYGVIIIGFVFIIGVFAITMLERKPTIIEQPIFKVGNSNYYMKDFPYSLPLLDIPFTEDFTPWLSKNGLYGQTEVFINHSEFRIDQRNNFAHIKIGITKPQYISSGDVTLSLLGLDNEWIPHNVGINSNKNEVYYHFIIPVEIFTINGIDLIQWRFFETDTNEFIYEIKIKRD